MAGRRPFATALKVLNGTGSHRPLNRHEPSHPPVAPTLPEELAGDAIAAGEWHRVIDELATTGHVMGVERATLAAYCVQYAVWRRALAEVLAKPLVIRNPKSGHKAANPAIAIANRACTLMKQLAVELGLTPASRTRVICVDTAPSATAVDAFTAMQRKGRKR